MIPKTIIKVKFEVQWKENSDGKKLAIFLDIEENEQFPRSKIIEIVKHCDAVG